MFIITVPLIIIIHLFIIILSSHHLCSFNCVIYTLMHL